MTEITETNTTDGEQTANRVTQYLLDVENGDELSLVLTDDTEIDVSVVRSLYLPDSVQDNTAGGSLRYAVRTTDRAVNRLDLPSQEGLISTEEPEIGSWNRPRLGFYDLVAKIDDDGNEHDDYGKQQRSYEIAGIASQ